jgi:putative ABC transport system permease protein
MRMNRLAWAQLRFRATRTLALLIGLLVAATAFTVLTAASRTEQLRTIGTVKASFGTSYDILVRPKGAQTALEKETGTVQPNFLTGIYGGITMAQWRQIQHIQGVQVAAPIAMVGYTMEYVRFPLNLPAADYAGTGRQLYRISTTWVSGGGSSRIVQPPSYIYYTPDRLSVNNDTEVETETLPGGTTVALCNQSVGVPSNPFGVAAQSSIYCGSGQDGWPGGEATVGWEFPMLIAAIDPDAEAALDGLNHAIVSGHYLAENAGNSKVVVPGEYQGAPVPTFPVLATTTSGFGEQAVTQVQRLTAPSGPVNMTDAMMTREATAPGQTVFTETDTAQQAYEQALRTVSKYQVNAYFTVGPVTYRNGPDDSLSPATVTNPSSVWVVAGKYINFMQVPPMDQADNQYRALTRQEEPNANLSGFPVAELAGTFDAADIRAFSPLSQVPLGAYQPVVAAPADAATSKALGGGDLLPNLNLGGYVTQPVQLVTTLSALPALDNTAEFGSGVPARDPISVIRVRVAGITGPNALSRARINQVAQQIALQTGLTVDIVAGSSPRPVTVSLPAGKFGQPRLNLIMDWVDKGVAVAILSAVDRQSVLLFALILVVCVLFVGNAATAAVRGRRQELGVLACLGWRRSRLFAVVLGEVVAIGFVAGLLSAAIALPVSAAAGLSASPGRALLAVPAAVVVAMVAAAFPAWLAARAAPAAAVRPVALGVGRGRHPRGVTTLALVNVARTPGRTLVGVVSLAVGIAGLTVLTAVTAAFRGVVVGSLLGNAIAVQVRGVDYVAIGATMLLGVLGVADVLFLNIRERAPELATIRSLGWRESALARLVVSEGAVIGLLGSLAGAGLGLAAIAGFTGQVTHRMVAVAVVAATIGLVITAAAALAPAMLLRRLPTAHLLAEE